MSEATKGSCG
uniref:Uncharacterized protein n=1 Tax=Arundo donax TaxID=35708 RepID=A0A0A9AG96_ARUDO